MKQLLKSGFRLLAALCVFPAAACSGFGRWESMYAFWAQGYALIPGLPGDYLRIAYYCFTLRDCSWNSRIQFGSIVAHPQTEIGPGVYIGCYCVLGTCSLGARSQIASGVQILSGRHQHGRGPDGRILGGEEGIFRKITVGQDWWIGAAAVIMADLGDRVTIGAGSVVTQPVPDGTVAVGSPARAIRTEAGA